MERGIEDNIFVAGIREAASTRDMDFSKIYKPRLKPAQGDESAGANPGDDPSRPLPRTPMPAGDPAAADPRADEDESSDSGAGPPVQGGLFSKSHRALKVSAPRPAKAAVPAGAASAPAQISATTPATAGATTPSPRPPASLASPLADSARPAAPDNLADILYEELIDFSRELVAADASGTPVAPPQLHGICAALLAMLRAKPYHLLALQLDSPSPSGTSAHIANVAIISLYLGIQLRMDDAELELLCYVALLHDTAMPQSEGMADSSRKLSPEDITAAKGHVRLGMNITDKIFAADSRVARNIKHLSQLVRERADGKGYPDGLKGDQLPRIGQLIGLADVYDALTHKRPWREPLLPYAAMIHLVQQGGVLFDRSLVKFFMETLTMFPPGCCVELSSGETAYVIGINKGLLTRPKVCTINDGKPGHVVDLLENQSVNIKRQLPSPSSGAPKYSFFQQ